jgi:dGTP triphosphohydrolase
MIINKEWVVNESKVHRGFLAHLRMERSRRHYREDEDLLSVDKQFVADEAKLLCCKAWRLMPDKTQVYTFPGNFYLRTRGVHVAEVVAIAVILAEHLGLNIDLVRAIALGHDIGHVPFGHAGEEWMATAMGRPEFCHEVMGPDRRSEDRTSGKGFEPHLGHA